MKKDYGNSLSRIAFWLVPEPVQREKLKILIESLANRFNATPFVPHVTLYSCFRSEDQGELELMKNIAESSQEIELKVAGLAGEDRLTRAFHLDLESNVSLEALYQKLHSRVHNPSGFILQPHLSLLYQSLSPQQRSELFEEICLDIEEIRFTELWAVAIPERIVLLQDLEGWQTLLMTRLALGQNLDSL